MLPPTWHLLLHLLYALSCCSQLLLQLLGMSMAGSSITLQQQQQTW
jgi:hypothetical protein